MNTSLQERRPAVSCLLRMLVPRGEIQREPVWKGGVPTCFMFSMLAQLVSNRSIP